MAGAEAWLCLYTPNVYVHNLRTTFLQTPARIEAELSLI